MASTESGGRTVAIDDVMTESVGEVMIKQPKTLPAGALVGAVRREFERPSVRTVLLADGKRVAGAIERDGLPADAPDDASAADYVEPHPTTVTPGTPVAVAIEMLRIRDEPRLIVLDDDGVTLSGLLCVNGSATGFCIR